ncbi:MAG: polysaccharide deacetylase family protein [Bacteroidetes bacterium]|nr:polysaccharide deacetylase family protein [Bacteroidota bacterium]
MLVFTEKKSNRLNYALTTFLLKSIGIPFEITTSSEVFKKHDGLKLNYSKIDLTANIQIVPHTILFDYGIKDYPIEVQQNKQFFKYFFQTSKLTIPFDLFGAAFWLLTRYEEYLPHKIDKYQRFSYKNALAYQYDFIEMPIINFWLEELKKILTKNFNSKIVFNKNKYQFLSSIDIDNAYNYKHKGFVRTLAGFISDLKYKKSISERLNVLLNTKRDPYDEYDFLVETHKKHNINCIYFILIGDYGINDKNHSATNSKFQSLIKRLADYSMIGVHPSFGSKDKLQQLKIEINRLSNITHKNIRKSRQHFSILSFPKTYNQLLQASIIEDYSMGYTNCNGFRASYCLPFNWYNIIEEKITDLIVYPYCISEVTLIQKAANKNIEELYKPLINQIKKYNGFNCIIFHNDTFNDSTKQLYENIIHYSKAE